MAPTELPKPPQPPQPADLLKISVESDAEIMGSIDVLAFACRQMLFTSTTACQSMEAWQRLFEANGFRFVRDTHDPTTRSQLYESLRNK